MRGGIYYCKLDAEDDSVVAEPSLPDLARQISPLALPDWELLDRVLIPGFNRNTELRDCLLEFLAPCPGALRTSSGAWAAITRRKKRDELQHT